MGIRKTLLIASTALVLPLAANASPFNAAQGLQPAVTIERSHSSDGLYHNANSVKDWWDNLGNDEGGEHNYNERGTNWSNEEGGSDEDGEEGEWGEDGGDESGERSDWNERGDRWNERGQFSWRDDDDRDGNWWNESGESGQHNWWNESGENGNNGKHKGWKHNKHGTDNDRWDEKGEWGDD